MNQLKEIFIKCCYNMHDGTEEHLLYRNILMEGIGKTLECNKKILTNFGKRF